MPQLRVSIRHEMTTGALDIHAVGPDGSLLPINMALATVTAAYHLLLIESAKLAVAQERRIQPANGADLDRLPKIEGL